MNNSRPRDFIFTLAMIFLAWLALPLSVGAESGRVPDVPFQQGWVGTEGSNPQQNLGVSSFASMGINFARFSQPSSVSGDFEIQGNDIPGVLKLFIDTGEVVSIDGAVVWVDKDAGTTQSAGFIIKSGLAYSFTNLAGTTTTLTGGAALGDISLELIGNTANYPEGTISNFASNPAITGSADTKGVLRAMNEYLAWVEANRPVGPVTVNSLVTTDTTPILTGTVTLDPSKGETLSVTVNGVVYTQDDPQLSVSGGAWTLDLSGVDPMDYSVYDVDAVITNDNFYTLNDGTSGELTIQPRPLDTSKSCQQRVDLYFLNDESGTVDASEFYLSTQYLKSVANSFYFNKYTGAKAGLIQWSGSNRATGADMFRELPLREDDLSVQSAFLSENFDQLLATNYGPVNREFSSGTRPEEAQLFLNDVILGGSSYTEQRKSTTTGRRSDASQLIVFLTQASGNEIADTWATHATTLRENLDNSYFLTVLVDKAQTAYVSGQPGNDGFGDNASADGSSATQIINAVVGLPNETTASQAVNGVIQGREGAVFLAGSSYAALDSARLASLICETAAQVAPIAVNNVTVSESSDTIVFQLQAEEGRIIDAIEVEGQSATLGVDTGSTMEIYRGGAWVAYDGTTDLTVDASGTLFIRMVVTNDDLSEGSETLTVKVVPALGTETSGTGTIVDDGSSGTVFIGDATTSSQTTADDDYVVSDVSVSEASPYLVFLIEGHANRNLTDLSLFDGPGSGKSKAIVGTDTHNPSATALQYFDSDGATGWQNYSAGDTVTIMGDGQLFLRTAVTQDDDFEGPHKLTLQVTPRVGVVKQGIGTIYDDGSLGTQFTDDATTASQGIKDDDRRIAINDVTVSEASTYLVFEVTNPDDTAHARQVTDFALSDGPDSGSSTGKGIAQVGIDTQDPGASDLQYFDPLAAAWKDYAPASTLEVPAGADGTLYLRTAITQDADFEGPHNFSLTGVSAIDANRRGTGVGTIVDDGSAGTVFTDDDTTSATGIADDDRPLVVNTVSVSESSPFIVWKIDASAGRTLASITLESGSSGAAATVGIDTADANNSAQFEVYDGDSWVDYSGSGALSVPSSGTLYVRTKLRQDSVYEGPETLDLTVTPAAGSSATGLGTIYDDGTSGTEFPATGPGATDGQDGDADDDRPLAVNDVKVSEESPYIVFKITGGAGRVLQDLDLSDGPGSGDGKAVIGVDTQDAGSAVALQVYVTGSGWIDYSPASDVTIDGTGLLYVRTAIVDDTLFEGPQVFTLTATPATGAAAAGQGTIYDDGSEQPTFAADDTLASGTAFNDDRPISVDDVFVSESSPYIVFKVSGTAEQVLNALTLANGSATSGNASVGTDTTNLNASSGLQVYDPVLIEWHDYTTASEVVIPSDGVLYLRTGITQDNNFEGEEIFTLSASSRGGASAQGTGHIFDDGSQATVFTDPSPLPATGTKDDDRPLEVNDVSVSEASDYIIFEITGDQGRTLSDLSLADGTAIIGVDTQNAGAGPLQYWDGSTWKDYASGLALALQSDGSGGGILYVRTGIVQDDIFETDPDPETFRLVVTPDGGAAPSFGTGSIYDDGSVDTTYTDPNAPPLGLADDDRPIAVNDVVVSESSAFIVFKVTGPLDRAIDTSAFSWLASGSKPLTVTSGGDVEPSLKCYNPSTGNWNLSTSTATNAACKTLHDDGAGGGLLYVRSAVNQDTDYEGPETATLTVKPKTGAAATGLGTVYDDGSVDTEFPDDGTANQIEGTSGSADDDRPFEVNDVSVSELSPYIVFQVRGTGGFELDSLSLASGTSGSGDASVGSDTLDAGTGTALQVYDQGLGWLDYNGTDNLTIPSSGVLYVRTAIFNDNDAPVYEGAESFSLTAVAASGGTQKVGTGTIYDDGSEATIFGDADTLAQTGTADDDRVLAVNNVSVSESSAYIVFAVTDNSSRDITGFTLADGSGANAAIIGTDTSNLGSLGVQINLADGSGWQDFTGAAIAFPAGGTLYVRTAVTDDDVLEHAETFTLTVTADNGDTTSSSATGRGTIVDDGTETTTFGETDTGPQDGTADDDRGIAINDVTVSEASPHIVFALTSPDDTANDRPLSSLVLSDGDASDGSCTGSCIATTAGSPLDTGANASLEYFDGSAWQSFTSATPVIPAAGKLYVRTSVVQDTSFEGAHKFTITATPQTGSSASGIGTIVDDGSQALVFAGNSTIATNGLADDDRPLSVGDVCVSENSTYIAWAITGGSDSAGRKLSGVSLKAGTSGTAAIVGTDTQDVTKGYQFRHSQTGAPGSWTAYTGIGEVSLNSSGVLYLLAALVDDDDLEGVESLDLTATPLTGTSATGHGYIFDDGSLSSPLCPKIERFDTRDATGDEVDETTIDDDRLLAINNVSVAESSSFIVFQITAQADRVISALDLSNGDGATAGVGIAVIGTDTKDAATGIQLQYYDGADWKAYVDGTTSIQVGATGLLFVRTAIVQDEEDEGAHAFKLTATPATGDAVVGTGTIFDDGRSAPVFNTDSTTASGNERDDDRAIAINDVSVSESSPFIVFELSCGTGTCASDRMISAISLAGSLEDNNQSATLAQDTRNPNAEEPVAE